MFDSDASNYAVNDMNLFETLKPAPTVQFELTNGARVTSAEKGSVRIDVNGIPSILSSMH